MKCPGDDCCEHGWKKGPLPKDTYGWGGVVPFDFDGEGFFFADFAGDEVVVIGVKDEKGECGPERTLKPHEVKWFNNAITAMPPFEGKPS